MGVDDAIEKWMKEAEATGELQSHPNFGKPLDLDDGYDETPEEMRMAYKILKNSGHVPLEVELLQEIAQLRQDAENATNETDRAELQKKADYLQLKASMALERMAQR